MSTNTHRNGLTQDEKLYICQGVAQFQSHRQIAEGMVERFGDRYRDRLDPIAWLKERIHYYASDPDAEKWQALIKQMRAHWRDGILEEPLANVRERVRLLAKNADRIEGRLANEDETPGALDVCELIALMREHRRILDRIAAQAGQKVERSKSDQNVNAQVWARATESIELRLPDFVRQAQEAPEKSQSSHSRDSGPF